MAVRVCRAWASGFGVGGSGERLFGRAGSLLTLGLPAQKSKNPRTSVSAGSGAVLTFQAVLHGTCTEIIPMEAVGDAF